MKKLLSCLKKVFVKENMSNNNNVEPTTCKLNNNDVDEDLCQLNNNNVHGGLCQHNNNQLYLSPNKYIYEHIYPLYNTIYISVFDKKLILFTNRDENLPLRGWFQKCLKCSTITGQKYNYGYIGTQPLYLRMCSKCSNFFNEKHAERRNIILDGIIEKYINKYKNMYCKQK